MRISTGQFAPTGIIPNYASMVIDGFNYGNGLCQDSRPDYFIVLNAGDEGKITTTCGVVKINTTCSKNNFILDEIVRHESGNHVQIACCEEAKKHKVILKCKAGTNCDANMLQVNLKKFANCDTAPTFVNTAKDFACQDPLTCTQKVVQFVEQANKLQTNATFSISATDPEAVVVEWNTTGERFEVIGWEGFFDPEIVVNGTPAIGKGKDLQRIFKDQACLPAVCDEDKCYKIYAFLYRQYISSAEGLFSGSTGINNNNAKLIVHTLVWIAVQSTGADAVHVALKAALNGGAYNLVCNDTCIGQEDVVIRCISREDAGDADALADIIADYEDAVKIERADYSEGISYYNVTIKSTDLPLEVVDGDTLSDTPCGPDETGG